MIAVCTYLDIGAYWSSLASISRSSSKQTNFNSKALQIFQAMLKEDTKPKAWLFFNKEIPTNTKTNLCIFSWMSVPSASNLVTGQPIGIGREGEVCICIVASRIHNVLEYKRIKQSIVVREEYWTIQPAAIGRGTVGSVSHWHLLSFNLLGFVITCQVHLLSYNSTAQNRSCVIDNQHRFREQELKKK